MSLEFGILVEQMGPVALDQIEDISVSWDCLPKQNLQNLIPALETNPQLNLRKSPECLVRNTC